MNLAVCRWLRDGKDSVNQLGLSVVGCLLEESDLSAKV